MLFQVEKVGKSSEAVSAMQKTRDISLMSDFIQSSLRLDQVHQMGEFPCQWSCQDGRLGKSGVNLGQAPIAGVVQLRFLLNRPLSDI